MLLDNVTCGRLRAQLLRACGARIGRNSVVRGGLRVQESFRLTIGDDVLINAGCCIDGSARVTIGSNVQIAYQVTLVTGTDHIGPPSSRAGERYALPITIGDGVWIGAGAILLPGVTVGSGAVIGAGAVVARDVSANAVFTGSPASVIRSLA